MTIPEPLRGADPNTWQFDTVSRRLPDIARRVGQENRLTKEQGAAIFQLADDIPQGRIRYLADADAPDSAEWSGYIRPYLDQTWLEVPWFFTEMYFFRRILEATGYFVPGAGFGLDPYRLQKMEGMRAAGDGLRRMAGVTSVLGEHATIRKVLLQDLWGNQSDMSIWPVAGDGNSNGPDGGHLLVDDSEQAADWILHLAATQAGIAIVVDNAGLEFLGDLLTIDFILRNGLAQVVELYLKPQPTFVSDATAPDLTSSIAFMSRHDQASVRSAAERLTGFLLDGRLRPYNHTFWTSPAAFWEMPLDLQKRLSDTGLVILKGDMNYRRLLGDRHWPYTTPIQLLPRALATPILALRVCKAEVAIGIDPQALDRVNRIDPAWRTNGQWGMLQLL